MPIASALSYGMIWRAGGPLKRVAGELESPVAGLAADQRGARTG